MPLGWSSTSAPACRSRRSRDPVVLRGSARRSVKTHSSELARPYLFAYTTRGIGNAKGLLPGPASTDDREPMASLCPRCWGLLRGDRFPRRARLLRDSGEDAP